MERVPELIVRAMQSRSPHAPLTSKSDPDFGEVWLVWRSDRTEPHWPDGYGALTEWLGVIDVPGHPQALMSIEWVEYAHPVERRVSTFEEFRRDFESAPLEASEKTRRVFKRAVENLDRVFDNVRAGLRALEMGGENDELKLSEAWIVKDELTLVCTTGTLTLDCLVVNEGLEVHIVEVFP